MQRMLERMRKHLVALSSILVMLMLALTAAPAARAQDTTCSSPHCYAILTTDFSGSGAYQVSGHHKWVCQATTNTNDFAVGTLWALGYSNQEWAEFGITTGTFSDGSQAHRHWYEARRFNNGGTFLYQEFYVSAAKPNRNQEYITVLRYDGADWRMFINNTQVGQLAVPDIGAIRRADAGAEITDSNVTASGSFRNLARQMWGTSGSVIGWPGATRLVANRDGVFPPSSVPFTSSSISWTNPAATSGCP